MTGRHLKFSPAKQEPSCLTPMGVEAQGEEKVRNSGESALQPDYNEFITEKHGINKVRAGFTEKTIPKF